MRANGGKSGRLILLPADPVQVEVLQELIEAEATMSAARPDERIDMQVNERNGSRPPTLSTKASDIDLRIPKLRKGGAFFPLILKVRECCVSVALYYSIPFS
jgi:transposase-like protein